MRHILLSVAFLFATSQLCAADNNIQTLAEARAAIALASVKPATPTPIPIPIADPFASDNAQVSIKTSMNKAACPCSCGCGTTGICNCNQAQAVIQAPVQQPLTFQAFQQVCTPNGCYQVPISNYVGQPMVFGGPVFESAPRGVSGCANGQCGTSRGGRFSRW